MDKNVYANRRKSSMFYTFALIIVTCLVLPAAVSRAFDHPTSYPYETRPSSDGYLSYQIIPIPPDLVIEKDVMATMPDGVRLACNVYRPKKPGKFPVILGMTPYGKDQTPPAFNPDGSFLPTSYSNYVQRLYAHGDDIGHQKISMLTAFEFADPAFWVPNDYIVIIADQRGGFKSEGKPPSPVQQGDDLYYLIEWIAVQEWSNGNVGMVGVSALASNQYFVSSRQPAPPHLKAIIPWEGQSDRYRDASFWGGSASFGITFDQDTELAGYMKVRLWVSAQDADDMDLFVMVKEFAGPCDSGQEVVGLGRVGSVCIGVKLSEKARLKLAVREISSGLFCCGGCRVSRYPAGGPINWNGPATRG